MDRSSFSSQARIVVPIKSSWTIRYPHTHFGLPKVPSSEITLIPNTQPWKASQTNFKYQRTLNLSYSYNVNQGHDRQ